MTPLKKELKKEKNLTQGNRPVKVRPDGYNTRGTTSFSWALFDVVK
jgi:hypothetical protein